MIISLEVIEKADKMDIEKCRGMADRFESIDCLKGINRRIAESMIIVHGFYTFTCRKTGDKVFIEGGVVK